MVPELFFLLLIRTFKPVLSSRVFCRSNMLGSFLWTYLNFLSRNCRAKTSACLTDNFFWTIFFAISNALFKPIYDLACPADKSLFSTISKISSESDRSLNEFAI